MRNPYDRKPFVDSENKVILVRATWNQEMRAQDGNVRSSLGSYLEIPANPNKYKFDSNIRQNHKKGVELDIP